MAASETRPDTLLDEHVCAFCKKMPRQRAELRCGHCLCVKCAKTLGQPIVDAKELAVPCPSCQTPVSRYWHTGGRVYIFYRKGFGPNGKLKTPRRRHRVRRRKNVFHSA